MPITASHLFRLAGLAAVIAGLSYVVVGIFHPPNVIASVTTTAWIAVHIFALALAFFGLLGLTGLYARQVEESGWLGLAGYLMLCLWLALVMGFTFVEIFILPITASASPAFVESIVGMFTGTAATVDLGPLPTLWLISGPLYIVGGVAFGIATFRAHVFPRWVGILLALGTAIGPAAVLFPPELTGFVAIPVGIALAWLGYSLWSMTEPRAAAAA
ncbi:MAG TPA: hypothetical protein VFB16_06870 [Bauldia sp.]|nr:hypothetical protein [Bauldia sp.]